MAFTTGVHIEFGYGGSTNRSAYSTEPNFAVDGETTASQSMSVAGLASIQAPTQSSPRGDPLVYVDSNIDIFVATGLSPDASQNPRKLVRAGQPRQWYVKPNDRVAWVEANS